MYKELVRYLRAPILAVLLLSPDLQVRWLAAVHLLVLLGKQLSLVPSAEPPDRNSQSAMNEACARLKVFGEVFVISPFNVAIRQATRFVFCAMCSKRVSGQGWGNTGTPRFLRIVEVHFLYGLNLFRNQQKFVKTFFLFSHRGLVGRRNWTPKLPEYSPVLGMFWKGCFVPWPGRQFHHEYGRHASKT